MEIIKVNLNREVISSLQIEKRQNFNEVLILGKLNKQATWKSPWFYGAVGLSSLAVATISFNDFSKINSSNEEKLLKSELKKINNDKTGDSN